MGLKDFLFGKGQKDQSQGKGQMASGGPTAQRDAYNSGRAAEQRRQEEQRREEERRRQNKR